MFDYIDVIENDSVSVKAMNLYVPPIHEIIDSISDELEYNFQDVSVEWLDCPDLRQLTIDFAAPGLCGSPALLEIGTLKNLYPYPLLYKEYNFKNLLFQLNRTHHKNFIIGASKHSKVEQYDIAELFTNILFSPLDENDRSMDVKNFSEALCLHEDTHRIWPMELFDTNCFIQGNFFLSEGKPGKILQIEAQGRTGQDFITSLQNALGVLSEQQEEPVIIGMGGIVMTYGRGVLYHTIPSSINDDMSLFTTEDIQQWLTYESSVTNVTAVGTITNSDTYYSHFIEEESLYITPYHFHVITDDIKGGHYYTADINLFNSNIYYMGYFTLAHELYYVDCSQLHEGIFDFPKPIFS